MLVLQTPWYDQLFGMRKALQLRIPVTIPGINLYLLK